MEPISHPPQMSQNIATEEGPTHVPRNTFLGLSMPSYKKIVNYKKTRNMSSNGHYSVCASLRSTVAHDSGALWWRHGSVGEGPPYRVAQPVSSQVPWRGTRRRVSFFVAFFIAYSVRRIVGSPALDGGWCSLLYEGIYLEHRGNGLLDFHLCSLCVHGQNEERETWSQIKTGAVRLYG